MTVRVGFPHHTDTKDRALLDKLVVESIQFVGFDVNYLPRTSNNIDTLFEDAEVSSFNDSYAVEMYFGENSLTGFGGEGDLITRFGYEVRDTVQLVIAVSRFDTEVGAVGKASISRPREGDLIHFPFSSQIYEITFVEDMIPFFQLGKNFIYQLECSLFQYADEDFDTGVTAVDAIETALSYQLSLRLSGSGQTFTVGTTVYQGAVGSETAIAEVASWNPQWLNVMNIQGTFKIETTLIGTEGTGVVLEVAEVNKATSQSTEIEALADSGIVDFSETNPFGDF